MRFKSVLITVSTCLWVVATAIAHPAGLLDSAAMPTLLHAGSDTPLPIWVDAAVAVDDAGQARPDLLGKSAIDVQRRLEVDSTECRPFDDVHISYALPPPRGSLDDAIRYSRTRLLARVTNKSFGLYSGFIPGQLLQVVPKRTFGKPLPRHHYYVFVPIGSFDLGPHRICKEDPAYSEPPEVGAEVFLFIAGPPVGTDQDLLMTYAPGDVVPVGRDGSLWLPPGQAEHSQQHRDGVPNSKQELLRHLQRLFPADQN